MNSQPSDRCRECGWATDPPRCQACGAVIAAQPPPAARMEAAALLAVHEEDYPQLRDAFNAYRGKEWQRYIGSCLGTIGVERPFSAPVDGAQVWAFQHNSAVIFIWLDRAAGTIAIDAPLVDVRPETEAALLRTTLSMAPALGGARIGRRGDYLALTMVQRCEAMSPPRLVRAVMDIAVAADALDNTLAFEFGVRLLGPQFRRGHVYNLAAAGTPRTLRTVTAAARPATLQPSAGRERRDSSGVVTATAVARFLDVVREATKLSIGLDLSGALGVDAAVQVSMALRAAHAGGLELDGSRLLLKRALMIRSGEVPSQTIRQFYTQLIHDRGLAPAHPVVPWPIIPAESAKVTLRRTVVNAARTALTPVRRTLLLGGLCELILFCELPPALIEQLRSLHDRSLGTDAQTVDQLLATLETMSK